MFSKYTMECQNAKIVKSKFKSEKSNKNKHKSIVVLQATRKKDIRINMMSVTLSLNIYFTHAYL